MSIRCEYQDIYTDLNRKSVLIGSYTIESIGNYYKSCEALKSTYTRYLNRTYRQRVSSWSSSIGKFDLAQPHVALLPVVDSGNATEMAPLIQRQKSQQVLSLSFRNSVFPLAIFSANDSFLGNLVMKIFQVKFF